MTRAFTPEQRAAIADRSGSSLLAANAGSGKTAVMVERFVEAVLQDGVDVGAILALTFTEKAAGELRERVRRRFTDLGEHEHARTSEGAAIGTIHGFCAGVLRAHPFAAGLDPRFTVLEEPVSQRVQAAAYDRALEAWAAAEGAPAVDLLAAGRDDLRTVILTAYAELRSRGEREPRLPIPPERPAPDPGPWRAATAAAASCLAVATSGKTIDAALAALESAAAISERSSPAADRPRRRQARRAREGARRAAVPRLQGGVGGVPAGVRRPPRAPRGRPRRPAARALRGARHGGQGGAGRGRLRGPAAARRATCSQATRPCARAGRSASR